MIRAYRLRRLLDGAAVALVTLAFGLYAWPVTVSLPAPADESLVNVPPAAAGTISTRTAPNAEGQTVTAANILSGSRRAPSSRYASPDQMPAPDYAAAFSNPDAFTPVPDSLQPDRASASSGIDKAPMLYGIVRMGGVAQALVRLSDQDVDPVLLGEGDRHGAYRVTSIRSDAVVLAGPSGTRTLRLMRPSGNDSIRLQQ